MIETAQKFKMGVAYLLLFSFLNVMTFLPGGNLHFPIQPAPVYKVETTAGYNPNRATVLELILENVAGLSDYLPNSEKPDFSYHFFNLKLRPGNWFTKYLNAPSPAIRKYAQYKLPLHAEGKMRLPLLQYHNFIFRLTPF